MRVSRAIGALFAVPVLAIAATIPASASAAPATASCPDATPKDPGRCLTVPVPLDRSGRLPGEIQLRVRSIAPTSGPAAQTILALAGGPGQAATPLTSAIARELGPALRGRQLVTFDQRGTGASGALDCGKAAMRARSLAQMVARCAKHIGPRRVAYTTMSSVADIEAVRNALGVDRLVLYGTSYGTKVALAYAGAYPDHVERLVLDSTLGPGGVDPLGRSTLAAFASMLRDLCRGGGCPFTADAAQVLSDAVGRVRRRPVPVDLVMPNGHVRKTRVTERIVLSNLLVSDLLPEVRAGLPAALASLAHGDGAPLLSLGGVYGTALFSQRDLERRVFGSGGMSLGLYLATTCEDAAGAWPAGTPVAQRAAALADLTRSLPPQTWGPFSPQAALKNVSVADICRGWPESPIPQPAYAAPTMPTLVLSGNQDLRTPPADAAALAATSPTVQVLNVPDTGHSVLGSDPTTCALSALTSFLDGQPITPCSQSARSRLTIDPLAPLSLADLPAGDGLPANVARTWRAVQLTTSDLLHRLLWASLTRQGISVGGLRAGRAVISIKKHATGKLTLDGYSYIPGVALTTTHPARKRVAVRITGAAATHGTATLDLAHNRLTATIAGHHLHARIKRPRPT